MGRDRLELRLPIALIIFLSALSLQSVVSAEDSTPGNPIIIDHSLEKGILLTSTISFTLFIENEVEPDLVHW